LDALAIVIVIYDFSPTIIVPLSVAPLCGKRIRYTALPLKVEKADGAPCSVVAEFGSARGKKFEPNLCHRYSGAGRLFK